MTTYDLYCKKCGGRVKDVCKLNCDNCDFCSTSISAETGWEEREQEREETNYYIT